MEKANELFHTHSKEFCDGPFKFAICMATYTRPHGKSPHYLQRSLTSILNQTASNWHVFLVGDKYESQDEFNAAASLLPSHKITAVNLPVAPEREHIHNVHERWKVAGANAFNHAHSLALNAGFDYILHLDDDDFFHIKKIQLLNYACSLCDSLPSFLFHYSDYIAGLVLPRFSTSNTLTKNNLIPQAEDCIHSS
jgi:glycosyltransferase involved in cell wall biosynthesis